MTTSMNPRQRQVLAGWLGELLEELARERVPLRLKDFLVNCATDAAAVLIDLERLPRAHWQSAGVAALWGVLKQFGLDDTYNMNLSGRNLAHYCAGACPIPELTRYERDIYVLHDWILCGGLAAFPEEEQKEERSTHSTRGPAPGLGLVSAEEPHEEPGESLGPMEPARAGFYW